MQLFVNHFNIHCDPFSNFLIYSCKSLVKAQMVLSSAKSSKLVVLNSTKETDHQKKN